MPEARKDFTYPRVLICEGPDDVVFFERLIEVWNLPRFHVRHTGKKRLAHGGNTQFDNALGLLKNNDNFAIIKDIVLVSDNDSNKVTSFNTICRQINRSSFGPSPSKPLERSIPASNMPAMTVIMVPLDENEGTLEFVCQKAARDADRTVGSHVDQFSAVVGADRWPLSRRGKFWLRTSLAVRASDPFVFLGSVFRDPEHQDLIPIGHPSFKPIADILSSLAPPQGAAGSSPPAEIVRSSRTRAQTRPGPQMRPPPRRLR